MANINPLFTSPPKSYDHPKLRAWKSRIPGASRYYVELVRRPNGLFFDPARLYFITEQADGPTNADDAAWDEDLNEALIRERIKARDPENEGARFGYMLIARFQPLIVRYNDGFFNSVLWHYLQGQPEYASDAQVKSMLDAVGRQYRAFQGEAAQDCQDEIEGVLQRCAKDLLTLGYGPEEGTQILNAALARFLDERFNVSNRKALGLG
ncbi:MAG TPA: hypothetical protein PKU97_13160 [Kofleriaceae bacterium]|nr:hypothetical protein [Kofleriaceae bacterium]